MIVESRDTIIGKVSEYLHWLTIPKKEFGNMPVCPYLNAELSKDLLYLDIWYTHDNQFMDLMESFLLSGKNSALIVCPNTHTLIGQLLIEVLFKSRLPTYFVRTHKPNT